MTSWVADGGGGGGGSGGVLKWLLFHHNSQEVRKKNAAAVSVRLIGMVPVLVVMMMVLASVEIGLVSALENRKFGDKCNETKQCSFRGAICNLNEANSFKTCQCVDRYPVTNHIDKCGKQVHVNGSCFFNEQCESLTEQTECRDGICVCMFEQTAIMKTDGSYECVSVKNTSGSETYIDPAMIGILVAMFLMFITICVVLRLFSRARWRENRTIFNTPNPRLMNVSLLRENKLLHERRGSRGSVRGPSRAPSMASLRPHSPSSQPGSRRGSRGSSNGSPTSAKSPTTATAGTTGGRHAHHHHNAAAQPMLESVTVEVQEHK